MIISTTLIITIITTSPIIIRVPDKTRNNPIDVIPICEYKFEPLLHEDRIAAPNQPGGVIQRPLCGHKPQTIFTWGCPQVDRYLFEHPT